MRTTLRIDDELLKEAKRAAIESDRTLTQVIEDALRETFARRKAQPGRKTDFKLPTFRGQGLQPGITWDDLSSTSRLLDLLDELDSAERGDADSGR